MTNTPKDTEALAEQLHGWYLEACQSLSPQSYNLNAQVSYADLTDEQKYLDRFIAEKILSQAPQLTPTIDSVVGERVATIIMQAIAPYHKPYKYLGEKSIETSKNEILTLLSQQQSHHEVTMREVVSIVERVAGRNYPGISFCPMDELHQCKECQERRKLGEEIVQALSRRDIPLVDKE